MQEQQVDQWIEQNKYKVNPSFRLRYHLMGEVGWINDPNGFCFYQGKYHLFYQFNPYDSRWGPMHWGHATSTDLIQWSYECVALVPDTVWDKDGCFSGTALVHKNQLILAYTGHIHTYADAETIQVQNLACSEDGIHFEKFKNNPILGQDEIPKFASKKDSRDPKLIEHQGIYYMLIGSISEEGIGQVLCFQSEDLTHWFFLDVFLKGSAQLGKMWECPDLVKLGEVDVLLISPQYMPSQGTRFNNLHSALYLLGESNLSLGQFKQTSYHEIDCGFDFYAPQTVVSERGETILIAWMDMWEAPKPTHDLNHGWAGGMTLPRVLSYKEGRVYANPIDMIKAYRGNKIRYSDVAIEGTMMFPDLNGNCYELEVEIDLKDIKDLIFTCILRAYKNEYTLVTFKQSDYSITLDRDYSGEGLKGQRTLMFDQPITTLKLRIFVDVSSIEVFINDGAYSMTSRIFPSEKSQGIGFKTNKSSIIKEITKWEIQI